MLAGAFVVGFLRGIVEPNDFKDVLLLVAAAYGITKLPGTGGSGGNNSG